MAQVLKQSTQIKVRVGPFLDVTDAVTPETGVTLGAADQAEALKADGAATVDISGATWAAVTGADGWYDLTLTTSHTDTVGTLDIVVQDSSVCLPVHARFQVVEESVYDNFYASSAVGPLTAAQVNTQVDTALTDIKLDHLVAVADADDVVDDSIMAKLASSSATADWSTFDNETDSLQAITDSGGSGPSAATIADAVWDELRSGHTTTGSFGEGVLIDSTAKSDYRLSSTGVDDIWDEALEGSETGRQLMRLFRAVMAGILSGAGTTTITIQDAANTKARVTATVDSSGNRSAVTVDLT